VEKSTLKADPVEATKEGAASVEVTKEGASSVEVTKEETAQVEMTKEGRPVSAGRATATSIPPYLQM